MSSPLGSIEMAFYDYQCKDCDLIFEIEKLMSDPAPDMCPECKGTSLGRYWSPENAPGMVTPRPTWAYNDCLKYKTATYNGVTVKIDPTKHGDRGAKGLGGEFVKKKK